jgi:5-methylcytosine-specific restriction endonuclease McrBC GTP-binding regulatory subunit McrB
MGNVTATDIEHPCYFVKTAEKDGAAAFGRYGKVILPGNLYIVGTVNMDETTFPFSKKVLDRANTIEFSYVNLLSMPSFSTASVNSVTVTNEFLMSKYITLNDCDVADRDYISKVCTQLKRINDILEIANAHIGYRVRDEIVFYMLNNLKADLIDDKVAFDNQIMQKILPRVQGSSETIRTMLGELLKLCESEKYEASAKKIKFMIKRYEEDGFTSYWL